MLKENKEESPLLSVVVPVYNVENYLVRCIESILSQTHTNLELILVDDGSTDSSLIICNQYKQKDSRIEVAQQANAGSSVARNTGLTFVKGTFIAFVDSDDWILPTMFEDMISCAVSKNLPVVECGHITSKNMGTKIEVECTLKIENKEEALERIIKADSFAVWRRIYRLDVLKGMRFIPGKIHQDVFYTLDVLDQISKMGVISGKYYVYNVDNVSVIRSAYSLKKLDAKDAVYYVRDISAKYTKQLQALGEIYLIKGLISHYIPLFTHHYLDSNFYYRKQLKLEIKEQYKNLPKQWDLEKVRAFIALLSPFWFYGLLIRLNIFRIKLKLKLKRAIYV